MNANSMNANSMTDNEIIKALECCIGDENGKDCVSCPLYEIDECLESLNRETLDLINRQKAENEKNEKIIKAADGLIEAQKAEIKGLKTLNSQLEAEVYEKGLL